LTHERHWPLAADYSGWTRASVMRRHLPSCSKRSPRSLRTASSNRDQSRDPPLRGMFRLRASDRRRSQGPARPDALVTPMHVEIVYLIELCARSSANRSWEADWLSADPSYHPFVRSDRPIPSSRPALRQSAARSRGQDWPQATPAYFALQFATRRMHGLEITRWNLCRPDETSLISLMSASHWSADQGRAVRQVAAW
jgi:hypothetical protein